MTLNEVRKRYLEFFSDQIRGHAIIPSASLVPENDPTTLFTGSGMQPLLPNLLGAPHPAGKRLVNSQKCFRAEDIEEVGDNRHTTFFEMLGNWSLGDLKEKDGIGAGYWKEEQLSWFHKFLLHEVGLHADRLWVTCFEGDAVLGLPRDDEAAAIWESLGIPRERIMFYGSKKNWWSRAGVPEKMPVGEPGGPDSEVFFDFDPSGQMHDKSFGEHCHPNCDCGRFMEIGNSVFMQYIKNDRGGFDELLQKNVDFGGGLERITAARNGDPDVFKIDALANIVSEIEKLSGKKYGEVLRETWSFRVVIDHVRAATFAIADGILPGNKERNYFPRRLLRRALYHFDSLGVKENSLSSVAESVIDYYHNFYNNLKANSKMIIEEINQEEIRFRRVLPIGIREISRLQSIGRAQCVDEKMKPFHRVDANKAFDIRQTIGVPLDVIKEELAKRGLVIDDDEYNACVHRHQQISRAGAEKKFKGGLADHSDMSIKYHTATHLLHQALRDVLGDEAYQKGSNITPERLRFDFSFSRKMSDEEKKQVEDIVNVRIAEALPVAFEIIPLDEAKARGAIGLFEDQYGENVKVYKIGPAAETPGATRGSGLYSLEFCGGPHVSNTSVLGEGGKKFKITKEEAISAGVRRIRAVLTNLGF
jgi:alanyl-tRNA synthetase